jgi:hypothetical protein
MTPRLRVLILGGYGTFGGRLARLLADEPRVELLIAGRSLEAARELCAGLAGAAAVPLCFDRDGDLDAQLRAAAPNVVVDASGPFQVYGLSPYRVVEACLACGAHYLDLADGVAFVRGIARFDEPAKARGVFVLSGVSTFPVLTAAAVRALLPGMSRLDAIAGGIAPSPYAGVGLNVIRAILSYAGRPVPVLRDGRPAMGHPLTDTRSFTVAPPGRLPLPPITFSLVDVPDLHVLAALWPEVRSVWMGAGPTPAALHGALRALAWLVRLGLVSTLAPLAGAIHTAGNALRWGEHRGGMFVEIEGLDEAGRPTTRSWHLLAEGDDGPLIPSMAAEAIVRRCLAGSAPRAGARPATRELELADYERAFAQRRIHTGTRVPSRAAGGVTLYRRLLGDAWHRLPAPLRALHEVDTRLVACGVGRVERGSWPAQFVATLFRFPRAGEEVAVEVEFVERDGRQTWTRRFDGRALRSVQWEGRGGFDRLLCERFGPLVFGLALVLDGERLRLVVRRWTLLGVPLPRVLAPRVDSFEEAVDGRFGFHVEIVHPALGLLVRYAGWLAVGDGQSACYCSPSGQSQGIHS